MLEEKEINRWRHSFIRANETCNITFGHLEYLRGKGVRKIEEADCDECRREGLNDGRWHPVGPPREAA